MRMLTTLALAVFLVMPAVGRADQKDPRLPDLFADLASAASVEDAFRIESRIWDIWTRHDEAKIDALMSAGRRKMQPGAYDEALAIFNKIVAEAPDFAEGWNKRATLLYLIGDLEGSVRDIESTLALEPRHFGALAGLGLIYRAINKPKSALKAFEKVLEISPQSLSVRLHIKQLRAELRGKKL
jgi:tetratricopeptide (TPR) repeat protein